MKRFGVVRKIGVPFELIGLVDENIEDFIRYKTGEEICIPEGVKSATSYQKKIS